MMNLETKNPGREDLSAEALVICVQCSDGKLRALQFDKAGKQAKQVYGYVRHIQGGRLKLHHEPLLLLQESERLVAAVEKVVHPPPTLWQRIHSWFPGFRIRSQEAAAC